MEILINIFPIFIIIFFIGSFQLYLFLEKKNIIKQTIHPYTNKPNRNNLNDFLRIIIFILTIIVSLFIWNLYLLIPMLFLTTVQIIFFYKDNKYNEKEEILFTNDFDRNIEDVMNENKNQKIEKFVITNYAVYLSKKKKILLVEKAYHYLVLNKLILNDNKLTIKYGTFGTPHLKKEFTIPKNKQKELLNAIKKVEEIKKKQPTVVELFPIKKTKVKKFEKKK